MIRLLQQVRQPFNVNAVAQSAAVAALSDKEWVLLSIMEQAELDQLSNGFKSWGRIYSKSGKFYPNQTR